MKPDWQDAPEWAKYLAMDECGSWLWCSCRPLARFDHWGLPLGSLGYTRLIQNLEENIEENINWRDTLEERP